MEKSPIASLMECALLKLFYLPLFKQNLSLWKLLRQPRVVKEGLVILGRFNQEFSESLTKKRVKKEGELLSISNYLDPDLVCFLDVDNQMEALKRLIDLLDFHEKLIDKEAFFHAILEREKIVSTGIGIGVAIPHAKLTGYDDFFIAIGIQKKEGIQWNALDGLPVRIIFMIGGPENQQTRYLKILSLITTAIKDEQRRKNLIKANSPGEVIAVFEDL